MELVRDEKVWLSLELDKEMWKSLCEYSHKVTLTNELVIKELIRKRLSEESKS